MSPGTTATGSVLEQTILPALHHGGYIVQKQVVIGTRPGGSRHKVDVIATGADGASHLVSLKWQQVNGTAEQKVPFEVICLIDRLQSDDEYASAYLVLGGPGWRLRDFYFAGGLSTHIRNADLVKICALEEFIAQANKGAL